jgi:RNA polymerase sigma-70 factor (ECF subfamily)
LDGQDKLRRFEEMISPHFESAFNLSRWLTGNRDDAEDVVQEAFLRAFASFHTFRGENGKPWLLAIVRNTAATWSKRRRTLTIAGGDLDDRAAREPGPEALLESERERDRVRQAVAQLVPEYRETIVLRELEGCSYKDIAAIIGVPLGTVMSRLARGREYLRQLLAPAQEKAR